MKDYVESHTLNNNNEKIDITISYTKRDALLKITEIVRGDSDALTFLLHHQPELFNFLDLSEIAKRKEGDRSD